jgi:nucleotide-binding universal stress UspA family protein
MTADRNKRSRILVAIDGSRESMDSLEHAARLGGSAGSADISLLHVSAPQRELAPLDAGATGLAVLAAPRARI